MKQVLYNDTTLSNHFARSRRLIGTTDIRSLNPQVTPAFGGESRFKVDKIGVKWATDLDIVTTISACTAGTPGTYLATVDWPGLFLWDRIELYFQGEKFHEISSLQAYEIIQMHTQKNDGELARLKTQLGSAVVGTRTTSATASQTFYLNLGLLFYMFRYPLDIFNLNGELEIRVVWKSSSDYVYVTDHTGTPAGPTLTSCQLKVTYVEPHSNLINKTFVKLQDEGGYLIPETQYLTLDEVMTFTGSAKDFTMDLGGLTKKHITYMNINAQLASNLTTAKGCDYVTNVKLNSFALKDSSNEYIDGMRVDTTDAYWRYIRLEYMNPKGIDNMVADYIYTISFCDDIRDQHESKGTVPPAVKDFSNITPMLYFNATGTSANYKVSVIAHCYKLLKIGGNQLTTVIQ